MLCIDKSIDSGRYHSEVVQVAFGRREYCQVATPKRSSCLRLRDITRISIFISWPFGAPDGVVIRLCFYPCSNPDLKERRH